MLLRALLVRGAVPLAAAAVTKLASGRGHGGAGGGGHGTAVASGAVPPEPERKGSLLKTALKAGLTFLEIRSALKRR